MKFVVAVLLLAVTAPTSLAAKNKLQDQEPFAWGDTGHNSGCVIFAEEDVHSSTYQNVDAPGHIEKVIVHVTGKLTLIETMNYSMDQKVIVETQANMDALMQRAHKDRVKFVKIPKKYSQNQLKQAREMCEPGQ
ncbi:MAG: hypothetical protein P4K94_03915 [Terracidiphilus sp.]|nr:hypothetical protein [Terracidiphilus sp.]